jgi:hypothetical protein
VDDVRLKFFKQRQNPPGVVLCVVGVKIPGEQLWRLDIRCHEGDSLTAKAGGVRQFKLPGPSIMSDKNDVQWSVAIRRSG